MVFFCNDNKRLLNNDFNDFMIKSKIIYEIFAFDISVQNEYLKKKEIFINH